MADIDKNPATLLAEQAALDPPQRREVDVAVALMSVSTWVSTARPRPNRSSLSTTAQRLVVQQPVTRDAFGQMSDDL